MPWPSPVQVGWSDISCVHWVIASTKTRSKKSSSGVTCSDSRRAAVIRGRCGRAWVAIRVAAGAQPVIAPWLAEPTPRAYLPSTPVSCSGGGRLVGGDAGGDLLVGELDVEAALADVDRDHVAVANGGDRAALDRLGRDVADHEPARGAGEAPVGEQGDVLTEPLADDRGGDLEHLAHPRPAGRALVADHDHVAGVDPLGLDGREAVLLGLEDARRAGLAHALGAGDLDHGAVRGEVAAQDREPALRP